MRSNHVKESSCSYYQRIIRRNRQNTANFALFLNIIENFALLGLSIYTSVDNYGELSRDNTRLSIMNNDLVLEIHKNCFCTFIVVSETYMLLSFYLNKNCRREPILADYELRSVHLKRNLFIINVVSIALASYFFVRHNDHCEGGGEFLSTTICIYYGISLRSSLHILCAFRIYCGADKHGLSHDCSHRLSQPTFGVRLAKWPSNSNSLDQA